MLWPFPVQCIDSRSVDDNYQVALHSLIGKLIILVLMKTANATGPRSSRADSKFDMKP